MTALEAMKKENNIIGFTSDSCYSAINSFLHGLMKSSKNTHDCYKRYYNEFFTFAVGKDIVGVTWDEILKIQYSDVLQFRIYLQKNKKNSDKTINQKISALPKLWNEFRKYDLMLFQKYGKTVNVSTVDVEPFKVVEEEEVIGSDALTPDEAYQLLEFAKTRSYKGYVQYVFFKTAISTSLRKESLFTSTVKNLRQVKDRHTNELYWCLVVVDKGKREMIKPITDELYEEIMELQKPLYRNNLKGNYDRLFPISRQKLTETLEDFCREYNIEYNITFHSLRKTSSDYANELVGGDIKKIQQQTGHKNPEVLINTYQGTRATLHSFPGLRMFHDEDNMEKLEQLSREELLEAIKQCDSSVARQILGKIEA